MTGALSTALFDVDGTLVDSNYLHTVAWWEAFGQAGHDVPMAATHRAVGMGSDLLLDALLSADRDKASDEASAPRARRFTARSGTVSARCLARRICCAPVTGRACVSRLSAPPIR